LVIAGRLAAHRAAPVALVCGLASAAAAQPAPRPRPPAPPRAGHAAQAALDRQLFPFFPLQAVWTNDAGVSPAAPSATDGVRLYLPSSSGELNVFALATGAALYSRPYATRLAPVVADGRVLVTGDKIIDALTAEDCSPLWKAVLTAPAAFSPLARGGWVFVALTDGAVAGLRADTGAAVWRAAIGQPAAAPVVEGDRLYAAATGGALQALSVTDGAPLWRATLEGDATAMAAVAGHLFVATSGRWLYALDAERGRVRWRFRIQGAAIGLAVDEDRVVAVTLDQTVRAFKIGSGAQAWRQELSFRPAGGPAITGASVLVTGFAPTVRAIDRRTGADQGLYRLPLPTDTRGISLETLSAGPVLAERPTLFDDMLVLVTQHGLLHGAKRAFAPAASPITVMPGTPVAVPAPPPGMPAEAAPPAAPAPAAPAPTAPATPPPTSTAPGGTPAQTPPGR
jgi:outer membrane protein assembly factor BamB